MQRVICGVVASIVTGTSFVVPQAQAQNKPAYAVVEMSDMTDVDGFLKAVKATEPQASESLGGHYLVRSTTAEALDGAPPQRFVVIEFPSIEKAREWYASPATKQMNATRMQTTKSRAFLVESLVTK
jgi:uncharacterized protein (DUF1330 family)